MRPRKLHKNSKSPKQIVQRGAFAITGKLGKTLLPVLKLGFKKNQYGGCYTNFIRENTSYTSYARTSDKISSTVPPLRNLYEAIHDTDFTGKVTIANGELTYSSKLQLTDTNKLIGKLYLSRNFQVDDTIVFVILGTYELIGSVFENIQLYGKKLTKEDIASLTSKTKFDIDETTFPDFDLYESLPDEYQNIKQVLSIIVFSDTDRTQSFVQAMPTSSAPGEGI